MNGKALGIEVLGVLMMVSLNIVPAHAQRGNRGGGPVASPQARIERLAEQLDLTTDQRSQLSAILEESRTKANAVREKYASSEDSRPSADMRAEMRSIQEETNERAREILTPEQYEQFSALGPARSRQRQRRLR